MSDEPFRIAPLEKKVGDLLRRVGVLERKAKAGGATTLDALRDTEVLYDHWTDLPKQDQALRWDTTRESKYHGLATFRDPTIVTDYFTASITGAGTTTLSEFLVDTDWDVDRPCLVTVTAALNGGYTSGGYPYAAEPPVLLGSLSDGDGGAVAPGPVPSYEANGGRVEIDGNPNQAIPLSWLYVRGRPKVTVSITLSAGQYAALSGPPELAALTRCVRL